MRSAGSQGQGVTAMGDREGCLRIVLVRVDHHEKRRISGSGSHAYMSVSRNID